MGRGLYRVNCAICHGSEGDGQLITPEALAVIPRDCTGRSHSQQAVVYKFSSANRLALDDDLRKTIVMFRLSFPGWVGPWGLASRPDPFVN